MTDERRLKVEVNDQGHVIVTSDVEVIGRYRDTQVALEHFAFALAEVRRLREELEDAKLQSLADAAMQGDSDANRTQ